MRALVMREFGAQPAVEQVDEPTCPPDAVIVEVRATGLCRSDWHALIGHDPDIVLPHVPGHELAGVIAELGRDVDGWALGDRVTVPFVCACGRCEPCRTGQHQVCTDQRQPGFTDWGSFAERVVLHRAQTNLVAISDGMDFATAASVGCRFSTAFHALTAQAQVQPGQWVAVHGCGGVGLSAVQIALALGARVVAVDVSQAALHAAQQLGAEAVVPAGADDVVTDIVAITGGGAHVSMDALGSLTTFANSLDCLRVRGTHLQVGLMVADAARPQIPMNVVLARELRVLGSHGMSARDFPAMLALIEQGRLAPDQLIRRRITLDEAGPALLAMGNQPGYGGITVVEFDGGESAAQSRTGDHRRRSGHDAGTDVEVPGGGAGPAGVR